MFLSGEAAMPLSHNLFNATLKNLGTFNVNFFVTCIPFSLIVFIRLSSLCVEKTKAK